MADRIEFSQAVEAAKQARELIQQYARPDYYHFLLDPIGQQTDPTKRAKEAMALLDGILSAPGPSRDAELNGPLMVMSSRIAPSTEDEYEPPPDRPSRNADPENGGEESPCREGGNYGLCKTHPTCVLVQKKISELTAEIGGRDDYGVIRGWMCVGCGKSWPGKSAATKCFDSHTAPTEPAK